MLHPALSSLLTLATAPRYRVRVAAPEAAADVAAAQRLRYEVFNVELGEGLAASAVEARDADEFDAQCDHLLVEEAGSGRVVGTYRLQTGARAAAGIGYYSGREFGFFPFEPVRAEVLELGRACVAVDHRNHHVLGLLWRGIAGYARDHGARYLVGCSSLTSQDEAVGLAAYAQLAPRHLAPAPWRTLPLPALRCAADPAAVAVAARTVKIPRLMTAYLTLGATICGEPAIDREFGTIDFLTWLDLAALPARVVQTYLASA